MASQDLKEIDLVFKKDTILPSRAPNDLVKKF